MYTLSQKSCALIRKPILCTILCSSLMADVFTCQQTLKLKGLIWQQAAVVKNSKSGSSLLALSMKFTFICLNSDCLILSTTVTTVQICPYDGAGWLFIWMTSCHPHRQPACAVLRTNLNRSNSCISFIWQLCYVRSCLISHGIDNI